MEFPTVINVEKLVKKFGDIVGVNDLSFEVQQGEIFGFLGPNGAGKTTTIRMILDLLGFDLGTRGFGDLGIWRFGDLRSYF